ncbi:MAG: hypothetical protein HYY16_15830 [Planctomycetes bacterium]|nr:hypothetical protein [Planctomycetota bacterium]
MSSIQVEKFASSTARVAPVNPVEITRSFTPEPGVVVVVRALTENPMYPDIELADGSFSRVKPGDIIAGVLGSRQALRGYVGYAPVKVAGGDRLQLLNLGGVIGRAIDGHKDLGPAVDVELLGAVVHGRRPVTLRQHALPEVPILGPSKPIILVLGSCMNVGKTAACAEIVQMFSKRGLRVGAAKVSGVGCMKDVRRMEIAGAVKTYTFLDCGVPSTVDAEDVSAIARSLAGALDDEADLIVMELGDGILGHYHVDSIFEDRSFMSNVDAVVYCASDLVSAWGGREILAQKGVPIDVICGPATDNCSGTDWIEGTLGLPAANALTEREKLYRILAAKIPAHHA